MIAFTPQSLKRARFEFARRRFFQKSGKTNAPTIGLDDKGSPPRSLKPQSSPPLLAMRDDYHKGMLAVLIRADGMTAHGAFLPYRDRTGNARFGVDTGSSLCALPSQIEQFKVNSRRLRPPQPSFMNASAHGHVCDLVGSTGIASKLDAEDWRTWSTPTSMKCRRP